MRSIIGTCLVIGATCAISVSACGKTAPPPSPTSDEGGIEPGPFDDAGVGTPDGDLPETSTELPDGSPELNDGGTGLQDSPGEAAAQCLTCSMFGSATSAGPVPAKLPELSGLAASARYPHTLYAHNDSGDTARFFAISDHAELQAEIDLAGAMATDWEDIAVGPCPTGSCVYLGDIGDNNSRRVQYVIFRAAEPDPLPTDGSAITTAFERLPFVYPDGPHNAETLLVHPATGRIFVVTKISGASGRVYELPLPPTPNTVATLAFVTTVSLPASAGLITSGKFHPCADRMLLRTYGGVYQFMRPSGSPLEAIFTATPSMVPFAVEIQGEAVTYSFDGTGYFTSSETVSGSPAAVLSTVSCLQ